MSAVSGIDWAADWHDVRVVDADSGELLVERRFAHDEPGIGALIELLIAHRVARVAIERPDGLLVGRLLQAGICVLAIHPNQVKAARERFRAAAGKSDRFDAFVLCELACTDSHRFPALAPSSDATLALRALVRTREDLVDARVQLANQLRAQLKAFWPGAAALFASRGCPRAGAEAACGLPLAPRLLRAPTGRGAARAPARRSGRRARRARAGCPPRRRAQARRRTAPDRPADRPA